MLGGFGGAGVVVGGGEACLDGGDEGFDGVGGVVGIDGDGEGGEGLESSGGEGLEEPIHWGLQERQLTAHSSGQTCSKLEHYLYLIFVRLAWLGFLAIPGGVFASIVIAINIRSRTGKSCNTESHIETC